MISPKISVGSPYIESSSPRKVAIRMISPSKAERFGEPTSRSILNFSAVCQSSIAHLSVCDRYQKFMTGPQIRVRNWKSFFLFLNQTYVVGTQKNRLNEHPKRMLKLMDKFYAMFFSLTGPMFFRKSSGKIKQITYEPAHEIFGCTPRLRRACVTAQSHLSLCARTYKVWMYSEGKGQNKGV